MLNIKNGFLHFYKRLLNKSVPTAVVINITLRCNLSCAYCDFSEYANSEMTTDEILNLIRILNKHGTIRYSLSGGEPLLRNDLGSLLREIKKVGGISSVVTNGTLLNERTELVKDADFILATIEGEEKIHDKIRGAGTFKLTTEGLLYAKKTGRKIGIIVPVSRMNYEGIKQSFYIARNLGCGVFFQPVHKTENWTGDDKIILSDSEISDIFEEILYWKKQKLPVANSVPFIKFVIKNPFGTNNQKCYAGKYMAVIQPDGKIIRCCKLFYKDVQWPNILTENLNSCFEKISSVNCSGCTIATYVESNNLFNLNIQAWKEVLKWYLKG